MNPPSAQRCDCGWDFDAKSVRLSLGAPAPEPRRPEHPDPGLQGVWPIVGVFFLLSGLRAITSAYSTLDEISIINRVERFASGAFACGLAVCAFRRWR